MWHHSGLTFPELSQLFGGVLQDTQQQHPLPIGHWSTLRMTKDIIELIKFFLFFGFFFFY